MNIDWFTFGAQTINFLILLALLKRFLYGPIQKAIAAREAEISARFQQAADQQSAAEASRTDYENRSRELVTAKQQLMADATAEVEQWKQARLKEARQDVERSRHDWFAALERERDQLRTDLLSQQQRNGIRLAGGVLQCLADTELEDIAVDRFVDRLHSGNEQCLPADRRQPVVVRSAFELPAPQRERLVQELNLSGVAPDAVQFHVDESLICGIELRTADHRISWNVRESLDWLLAEFTRDLDQTLAAPDHLRTASETEAAHAR